ncbi:MAG: 50S ribosomal protein L11 methyltransferase [Parvularculaceae bacterium]|nr:50S ribosomal protein L11 methyltransferase [Parvularculaceae bacterium]
MPTYKAIWTGPEDVLQDAGVRLTDLLYPPADAISVTKANDAAEDRDTAWRLEAYFSDTPDRDSLLAALSGLTLDPFEIEELPDIDWVAHALAGLGVVEAGRFILYGVHDEDNLPDGADFIPIRIDANQAFGTGHHPTTAGCLELLSRFAGFPPDRIFDLGCGSAVLSIAAAKLWERDILASDIDERSVEIARENVALNDVDDRIEVVVADGFDAPAIAARAPFDFIFANILAGPLVEFAPIMAKYTAPRGRVMLAGLMASQEQGVAEAYLNQGFKLLNRLDHQTWPVLLFIKM